MTKEQLMGFRTRIESDLARLEQRTADVRRELRQTGEAQPTVIQNGLDHAKEEADLTARLELNERDLCLVARLRFALDKITHGTYGNCELCEEPIDLRRMNAHPTAILCIGCQSRAERFGAVETPARDFTRGTLFDWTFGPARYGMA